MSERSRHSRLHRPGAERMRRGGDRHAAQAAQVHDNYRRVIDHHYCVHHDDVDVTVYDHDGHGAHRQLDHDEQRALYDVVIRAALQEDPALVLDVVAEDHDFLRALETRRGDHHIDLDP